MDPSKQYDVIVVGVGSMGAAACYYLSKRGYKVLGLEQFTTPHDRGSHGGQSRIIRKAYFEHVDYIPLLQRAYENWKTIEMESGEIIFHRTGLYYAGPKGHSLLESVKNSAVQYQIPLEILDSQSSSSRFPLIRIPPEYEALFEPDAGLLTPETAIRTYVKEARNKGAEILENVTVRSWKKMGESVQVVTDWGTFSSAKIIFTAGSWTGKLLPDLSAQLTVTRQVLAWFEPKTPPLFFQDTFPSWLIAEDGDPGAYYGFPILRNPIAGGPSGFKIAYHFPGKATSVEEVDRSVHEEDIKPLRDRVHRYFPDAAGPILETKTCLYTMSSDEHFIVDHLPGFEEVACVACGFSGHGFKFVAAIGEILSDLATQGNTSLPIHFLRATRF